MADNLEKLIEYSLKKSGKTAEYYGLTEQLILSDEDKMNDLFDKRQDVIDEILCLDSKIDGIIGSFPAEEKEILKLISSGNEYDGNEFTEYRDIAVKLNSLKALAIASDKKLGEKLLSIRNALKEQLNQLAKSRQVMDYMGTTTQTELFKGNELDQKL
ncbi:MAG TPA: hypothetical protein PKI60_05220 [Oscillospiraceae bacterium]|nr:hypothetical protein [Oscillospiraceae bacterium]